jgi:hypothetical protein
MIQAKAEPIRNAVPLRRFRYNAKHPALSARQNLKARTSDRTRALLYSRALSRPQLAHSHVHALV